MLGRDPLPRQCGRSPKGRYRSGGGGTHRVKAECIKLKPCACLGGLKALHSAAPGEAEHLGS